MVYQGYGGMNNPNMSGDQNRKIFLGGLNYHTTDDTLRGFCSRFGKITDCLVMRTPEGKSRGFGFVTYEDTQSVEEFMRSRPHTIDNRQIDPKRAMPREEQNSSEAHLTVKKLFVAGLREGINEDNLRAHFSRFGNIVEILIMKDREGKPRGFAFVTYDDYDAVDKAVLEKPHVINGKNLDVKKAVPKEKMQDNSGFDSSTGGNGGMPPYNRNNSSNYPGSNMAASGGPPPPPSNPQRNNYGSMRDNYNNSPNNWGNNQGGGGMQRMSNQSQNYNQSPSSSSSYGPQGGYNANVSNFNSSMPPNNSYSQQYNPMGQNQPPPPPPPPMPQQQSSMMNYDMYNTNNPNMSYNNQPTSSPSNYMQPPPPQSYGQNQQQGFGNNSNAFGGMNNPFNPLPPPSSVGSGGYNNPPTGSPYDTSGSYGITSQNYGGNTGGNSGVGNYNNMSSQPSRGGGGGPMRNNRTGGNNNFGGPSNNEGNFGNRSAPYPSQGGGRGGGGRGRGGNRGGGRGRGQ